MKVALNASLNLAFAECTGLALIKITLPDVYEDAIVATEVVNQEMSTA